MGETEGSVAVEEKTETKVEETQKPEVVADPLDDIFSDESIGETGDKPSLTEVKTEEKTEEKKDTKEKGETEESKETEEKTETKTEEKKDTEGEKGKVETKEKSKVDWDSEDNPYRKQYNDTRDWASKVNSESVDLKKQVEVLGKKIDGTYDPEEEARNAPSTEQVASDSELKGSVSASLAIAEEMYGKENVHKLLFAENAPFKKLEQDPAIAARVMNAKAPILEAITVLKEKSFFQKYGKDPEAIKSKIEKEVEERLTKSIREEVTKELTDKINLKSNLTKGVSEIRGSNEKVGEKKTPTDPLDSILD